MQDFIQGLPKVELHVHLEGSVTPQFWYQLLQKHGGNGKQHSLASLEKRFQYTSFLEFLWAFRDVLDAFQQPDDFYDLTLEFLKNSAAQNIRYCEVMMTPFFMTKKGMDLHEILQEIDRAAKEAEQRWNIEMKLLFDGPRNFGNEVVRLVFDQALADKTGRVIGVGLGGDEANFPARDFIDEFAYARASGLEVIAHA
ncbi:MAG: hypothetical protein COB67_06515, partial [SAR324 cluster bacterium]